MKQNHDTRTILRRATALALTVLLLCTAALGAKLHLEQRALAARMIRLHVVANSDDPADQARKLDVRDAVLPVIARLTEGCADVSEARTRLRAGFSEIRAAAGQALARDHCRAAVTVSLAQESFPSRDYQTFSLPAGDYSALRVTIGAGEGHNWWCVAFPALCTAASVEDFTEDAAQAGMTDDQVALTQPTSRRVHFKFRALEFIRSLFG